MSALVDAAIVSYNTKIMTTRCIESLLKSVTIPITLTVWDNASTDGSAEFLRNYGETRPVRVITSPENVGYGRALNGSFKGSTSPYVLCLNSDLEFPKKGWLKEIIDFMESRPQIGACGPLLLDKSGRVGGAGVVGSYKQPKARFYGQPLNKVKKSVEKAKECISVCGACFVVRRDAFEKIGGFDERFFFYYEETSLCRTLRLVDKQVWYYPTTVVHYHGQSTKSTEARKLFEDAEKVYDRIWGDKIDIPE